MLALVRLARRALLLAVCFLPALAPAASADILIVNVDGTDEGFNDPEARAPVGGNTATTLGEQRLAVFEYAASLWMQVISSPVDILVQAKFDPLTCNETSAVLGSAGATNYFMDFPGALRANTWYPAALANSLRGIDNEPGQPDLTATFNSTIGTTCDFPSDFYYGLDGNAGGQIDLVSVVLHELGHGLGFATIVDLATGQKGLGTGIDDIFMVFLENHSTDELYPDMTNAERVAASIDTGNLHWTGDAVVSGSTGLSSGRDSVSGHVQMYAPNPARPGSSVSHWDTALDPDELMEPSYTGPVHDVGLAFELFHDIGWLTLGTSTTVSTSTTTTTTTALPPTTTTSTTTTSTTLAPTTTAPPPTTTTTVPEPTTTEPPPTTTTVPVTTTLPPATTTTVGEPTTTTAPLPTTSVPGTTTTVPEATTTTSGATTSSLGATTTTTLGAETRDCGDFSGDESITASDALAVLRVAVASQQCATCVCDTNGSGFITASDALTVLRHAVGLGTALTCPSC